MDFAFAKGLHSPLRLLDPCPRVSENILEMLPSNLSANKSPFRFRKLVSLLFNRNRIHCGMKLIQFNMINMIKFTLGNGEQFRVLFNQPVKAP